MKQIKALTVVVLLFVLGLTACDSRITHTSVLPTHVSAIPTATSQLTPTRTPTMAPGPIPTMSSTAMPTEIPYRWSHAGSLVSMNAMTFVSDYEAWAVGDYGYIAHWEGALGWKHVSSPTETALYAVFFISPDDGWIVGDGGQILHWDGEAWSMIRQAQTPYAFGWPYLHTVAFAGPDDGWALGCIDTEGGSGIWGLHWDGREWQEASNVSPLQESLCFTAMAVLSPDDIWAVGGGDRGITLHWDGSWWHDIPNPAGYWLYSLDAITADNVWAVGIEDTREGYAGIVIHWDGTAWSEVELPATGWINDVAALSDDDIWVGGDDLLHWDGREWEKFEKPVISWDRIIEIEIAPGGHVWALTEYGEFLSLGIASR
ncbi:MAG TPA: hypothetical protein PK832_11860 [Anaerolineae bacterium]|nr:hypothetical protein [Anaerolineae bacterium]